MYFLPCSCQAIKYNSTQNATVPIQRIITEMKQLGVFLQLNQDFPEVLNIRKLKIDFKGPKQKIKGRVLFYYHKISLILFK